MTWSSHSALSPAFIGRASQLAALTELITRAGVHDDVPLRVALIAGEAGIGKSRLAAEAQAIAAQRGMVILQGRCFEQDRSFPYAPLLDMLRVYCVGRSPDELAQTFTTTVPDLIKISPELSTFFPTVSPSPALDPEPEKRRIFQALVQWLAAVGTHVAGAHIAGAHVAGAHVAGAYTTGAYTTGAHVAGAHVAGAHVAGAHVAGTHIGAPLPLLIVIEDLHWCDDTSLAWLLYLARHLTAQPLLLLLTYRDNETPPALNQMLAALGRAVPTTEITLSPLTRDELGALLWTSFNLSRPPRSDFLDALHATTEGNPLFIEEVLKSLIAAGDIFKVNGQWEFKPLRELRIPRTVQVAMQQRTSQLSLAAQRLLTLAAVAGRRFDFALLQTLSMTDEAELVRLLKELIAAQLLHEESAETFAFRHALIREALYTTLLAREQQAWHRLIAEALERLPTPTPDARVVELAYHFHAAGVWDKALQYAQRAGEQAQRLGAPQAVITHYTRAIESLQKLATPILGEGVQTPASLAVQLFRARGRAHETLGEFEAARYDYTHTLAVARAQHDRQAEWQALFDLGFLWAARDYTSTQTYLEQALYIARTLNEPATLARTLNRIGNWYLIAGQHPRALALHQEALSIFEGLSDQRGLAETLDLLGLSHFTGGDYVTGADDFARVIPLWRALGERQGLSSSLATLAIGEGNYLGEMAVTPVQSLRVGLQHGEEAWQIAREIGWRAGEVFALTGMAANLGRMGAHGRALALARQGVQVADEIEHQQVMAVARWGLGIVLLDVGALAEAQQALTQALQLAQQSALNWVPLTIRFGVAVHILRNELASAEAMLAEPLQRDMPARSSGERSLWVARAQLALAQGDAKQALQIADRLVDEAAHGGLANVAAMPQIAFLRGEALAALRRKSDAEAMLQAAIAGARQRESRSLLWRALIALGKLYRTMARSDAAAELFAEAQTLIKELAETIEDATLRANFVAQAMALIPRTESAVEPKPSKHWGGLSAREREVAKLVAQGQSNREIAETLVLSQRTVESHIANIMAKLGFTARTQIATWVAERGVARD